MSLISSPFYYIKTGDCLEINKLNKPRQNNHWLIEVLCLFFPFLCHLCKCHLFFGTCGLIYRPTWAAKYCDNIYCWGSPGWLLTSVWVLSWGTLWSVSRTWTLELDWSMGGCGYISSSIQSSLGLPRFMLRIMIFMWLSWAQKELTEVKCLASRRGPGVAEIIIKAVGSQPEFLSRHSYYLLFSFRWTI